MARSAATATKATPARAYQTALRRAAAGPAGSPDRVFEFIFSDGTVDRMGDTIDPDGWDVEAYQKNPVVLFAHDNYSVPVGRCIKIWVEGDALCGQVQLGTDPRAEEVYQKLLSGELNAVSVGFQPKIWEFVDTEEQHGMAFKEQELLEVSIVPVPANPNALIRPRTKAMPTAKPATKDAGDAPENQPDASAHVEKLAALCERHEKCVKAMEDCVKSLGEHVEKLASYGSDAVDDGDGKAASGTVLASIEEILTKSGIAKDAAKVLAAQIRASAEHVLSDTQYQRVSAAHKSLSKAIADHHAGQGEPPASAEPKVPDADGDDDGDEEDKAALEALRKINDEAAAEVTRLTGKFI